MAFALVNGAAVIDGQITLPRIGAWTADLVLDTGTALVGSAQLVFGVGGSISFNGAVVRGGLARGYAVVRLVGGAGGLRTLLAPKAYGSVALKLPLSELLAAAGEALSATSDAAVLALQLNAWTRMQTTAGGALVALLQAAPTASWRFLPDGTLWVGNETWPTSQLAGYLVTKDDPNHKRQELAVDVPAVFPGQVLNGQQVSGVEHRIRSGRFRTVVYYEG
jgi:hypothetical protein